MLRLTRIGCAALVLVASASVARGQSVAPLADQEDHRVVFELGWAGDWSPDEGWHPKGITFAVEVTPIEHWLELEVGVSAIRADGVTEVPIDVLFKKPWQLSRQVEFMAGIGPEMIREMGSRPRTNWGLSCVLDFMFWPRKNVGWYLEPGYEVTFHDGGAHHGAGVAGGLLIGR